MPFVDVKLSKKITDNEAASLKSKLGEFITVFPGKSEDWLMCVIDSEKKIWFRGDNTADSAFVEVKLFGAVNSDAADKFTALLCDHFKENLGISPDRVYVRYEGGAEWGWNGSNF